MTMVERVAAAIENTPVSWSIKLVRLDESGEVYRLTMDDKTISEGEWREDLEQQVQHLVAEKQARAAIAAMRITTLEMIEAGQSQIDLTDVPGRYENPSRDEIEAVWQAMFDAVLAEHDAGA